MSTVTNFEFLLPASTLDDLLTCAEFAAHIIEQFKADNRDHITVVDAGGEMIAMVTRGADGELSVVDGP